MMEIFVKIVNSLQKYSFVDAWLGSKQESGSLDAPSKMTPLKSFILQYLCHNQFVFCFWKWKHYIEKAFDWQFHKI